MSDPKPTQALFEWLKKLFDEPLPPTVLSCHPVTGRGFERLGPLIQQTVFPSANKPTHAELAADIQCKSVTYGLHVSHKPRSNFYERYLYCCAPTEDAPVTKVPGP